jgi:hypothetical protein
VGDQLLGKEESSSPHRAGESWRPRTDSTSTF